MIKTQNLVKIYNENKENEVRAIDGVTMQINNGTSVCIIGRSGCGKSTLLHMIGGLDRPTSGDIYIENINITAMKENELSVFRRENIGFVFQSYNLVPELTIKENILFPLLLTKQKVDDDYFLQLTQLLGLTDRLNHLPSQLSGGQQQRAAIARALVNKPKIILCDEPTGNLDYASSERVKKAIFDVHKNYKPILIIVTHDSDFTKHCEKTIVLHDGKIEDKIK